ncbi:MAG: hypothetical protein ACR2KS_10260 [Candidatus Eremiobacter antarcticus]|nr:hypothetical protein [Candidatus Eremiobacteraeota bacterium]MBC5808816.1 hypothetical protein [Candidatus Eremiobacteraeota bacterium]
MNIALWCLAWLCLYCALEIWTAHPNFLARFFASTLLGLVALSALFTKRAIERAPEVPVLTKCLCCNQPLADRGAAMECFDVEHQSFGKPAAAKR